MKKNAKIILAVGALAVTGCILYLLRRKSSNRRLEQVANEGYETADDILFPNKPSRHRKHRHGPVTH